MSGHIPISPLHAKKKSRLQKLLYTVALPVILAGIFGSYFYTGW
ncbi:hypothetical protein [Alkalicoccus daliensis]|uniref:Uncharacterized protein n=1 Tax=Alkalicoccus daliensis TaxID=745820 RepID=A0A1H0IBT1_9BACI|nr:hypothetical protein [Alkalicoccus daliensis]SDO28720.1 hypothetical protein SAMN04488053_11078 [Alkalicoccus daliensis]